MLTTGIIAPNPRTRWAFIAALLVLAVTSARAQELEPRAYSPSPVGTNFVGVAAGTSSGAILFDPSVPITDLDATVYSLSAGYGRTFALWKRQALVTVSIPYAVGHFDGNVYGEPRTARRSGLADMRVKFSYNVIGVPAMTPAEFAKTPLKTIFGVSLTVQPPTGQYDPTKLINLGTNRWSFKPEVGVSVPVKGWSLETYLGTWFYTDNDAFFPGESTQKQDPLTSLQAHVSYTFKNRAWLAADATWYGGGQTTIDDQPPSTRLSNSRYGATYSQPLPKHNSLKLSVSKGASARAGQDFTSYVIGWQILWFDPPRKPAAPKGAATP